MLCFDTSHPEMYKMKPKTNLKEIETGKNKKKINFFSGESVSLLSKNSQKNEEFGNFLSPFERINLSVSATTLKDDLIFSEKVPLDICEYESQNGEKEIIIWKKFFENGYFLDYQWYQNLDENEKWELVHKSGSRFFQMRNGNQFQGKWFNGDFFGNGVLVENVAGERRVEGFWFGLDRYFNFVVDDKNLTKDQKVLNKVKEIMMPVKLETEMKKTEKILNFENDGAPGFQSDNPSPFILKIENETKISTDEKNEILTRNPNLEWILSNQDLSDLKPPEKASKENILKTLVQLITETEKSTKNCILIYPNKDVYIGDIDFSTGLRTGNSKYFSHKGYIYEGNFLMGKPFGKGNILDSFRRKHTKFFFDGIPLESDHGIEKAYNQAKIDDKISDSEFYYKIKYPEFSQGKIESYGVDFETLLFDIERGKKGFLKIIEDLENGEIDQGRDWESDLLKKINKSNFGSFIPSDEMALDNIEIDEFDFLNSIKPTTNIEKMDDWKKKLIIELVRDNEYKKFRRVYQAFKKNNLVFELFNIKNDDKQNLIQIGGELGFRQLLIDILTAIFVSEMKSEKVIELLENMDVQYNSLVDLICIRGYDIKDEKFYCPKIRRVNWESGEEELIPKTFVEVEKMIFDLERKLFVSEFVTSERVFNSIEEIKQSKEIKTSELSFLSMRSICLKALFHFVENYKPLKAKSKTGIDSSAIIFDEYLSPSKHDSHSALHFTLYHADLHSSLLILKKVPFLIFRQKNINPLYSKHGFKNKFYQDEAHKYYAAHDTVLLSKVKWKSMAIFMSCLEEITRIFNFKIIQDFLIDSSELKIGKMKISGGMLGSMFEKIKMGLKLGAFGWKKKILGKTNFVHQRKSKWGLKEKVLEEYKERVNRTRGEKNQIEKIVKFIEKKEFDFEKVSLYQNEYVLLSEELSKSYIKRAREKMKIYHLKMKSRFCKNLTLLEQISPFEATQKLILDFLPDTIFSKKFWKSFGEEKVKKLINDTLQLITWYLAFFGDAPVNPEIFTKFRVKVQNYFPIGEKNLIHIICENNSYLTLEKILQYYKEKLDREISSNPKKSEKLKKKFQKILSNPTTDSWNTPGHISLISQSNECLSLLSNYNVNLENLNRAGHSVRDLIKFRFKNIEIVKKIKNDNSEKKVEEIVEQHMSNLIKLTCKNHSFKLQTKDIQGFKKKKNFVEKFEDNIELTKLVLQEDFEEICNLQGKMGSELNNEKMRMLSANTIVGDEEPIIQGRGYLDNLLNISFLEKIENFSLSNYEKIFKKSTYDLLKTLDFNKLISSENKIYHHTEDYFYIKILIDKKKNQERELGKNIVMDQVKKLKERYGKQKGGLNIKLVKGLEVTKRSPLKCFCCPQTLVAWFLVFSFSDELLYSIAEELDLDLSHQKLSYVDKMNLKLENDFSMKIKEIRILNNQHKMKVVRHIIEEEFDIDKFMEKEYVSDYGLLHNYDQKEQIFESNNNDIFISGVGNYFSVLESYSIYVVNGFILIGLIYSLSLMGNLLNIQKDAFEPKVLQFSIGSIMFGTILFFALNHEVSKLKKILFEGKELSDNDISQRYRGQVTINFLTGKLTEKKLEKRSNWKALNNMRYFVLLFIITAIFLFLNNRLIKENVDFSANRANGEAEVNSMAISIFNFILSKAYNYLIRKYLNKINFRKENTRKGWMFFFSLMYELVNSSYLLFLKANSKTSAENYLTNEKEMLTIIATTYTLNMTFGILIPVFLYAMKRYHFKGVCFNFFLHPLTCFLCCKIEGRGKIEDFKQKVIQDYQKNPKFGLIFSHYILDKPIKNCQEKTSIISSSEPENQRLDQNSDKDLVERLKNLEKPNLDLQFKTFFDKRDSKRKQNIKTRLKEEFFNYIMLFEKLEESSFMIDPTSVQVSLIRTIVIQFTYIIAFSIFSPSSSFAIIIFSFISIQIFRRSLHSITKRNLAPKVIFNFVPLAVKLMNFCFWFGLFQQALLVFFRWKERILAYWVSSTIDTIESDASWIFIPTLWAICLFIFLMAQISAMSWYSSGTLQNPGRSEEEEKKKLWDTRREVEFYKMILKRKLENDVRKGDSLEAVREEFLGYKEKFLSKFFQNRGEVVNEVTPFGNINIEIKE